MAFIGILQPPPPPIAEEIIDPEDAGPCFSVTSDDPACFSITSSEEACFTTDREQGDNDDDEPDVPDEIALERWTIVRDVIKHGHDEIIVMGIYQPSLQEEPRPVLAKLPFTSNFAGALTSISPVTTFVNLTDYDVYNELFELTDPLDMDDASLECFDVTSTVSNLAIKTSTAMIYIEPVLLLEINRVTDPLALLYPFANTEDTYWTNTLHWSGATLGPSGVETESGYNVALTYDACGIPGTPEYGDYYGTLQRGLDAMRRDRVLTGHGDPFIEEEACEHIGAPADWNAYAYYRVSGEPTGGYPDVSPSFAVGHSTIARKITDESDQFIVGFNSFHTSLRGLTVQLTETPDIYNSSKIVFSGTVVGQQGEAVGLPSEVNLSSTFANLRDEVVFGNGYIAVGERGENPVRYAWENANGFYWIGGVINTNGPWTMKNGTGFSIESYADTEGMEFYLAPFSDLDIRKVQIDDQWISMGVGAIKANFTEKVDAIPEANGIPSAIVGDRCLVPVETPEEDENGVTIVIDHSFKLSENSDPTRAVIFPS